MSNSSDVFKSFVRSAAQDVLRKVRDSGIAQDILRTARDLKAQRTRIGAEELSTACTSLVGAQSVTVDVGEQSLHFYVDGNEQELSFALHPEEVRFASRGAKEVHFLVEPNDVAAHPMVADIVGAVGTLIASRLWTMPGTTTKASPIVTDREGNLFRVDLRDAPNARALRRTSAALLLDAISLRSIEVDEHGLFLEIFLRFA